MIGVKGYLKLAPKKIYSRVAAFVVILLAAICTWALFFRGEAVTCVVNNTIHADPSVTPLSFQLKGSQNISHEFAIPHRFTVGNNSFHFDGRVYYEGTSLPLKTKDMNPILMARHDGKLYLLCQHYFQRHCFLYLQLESQHSAWKNLKTAEIPFGLRAIEFEDVLLNKLYRGWIISQMQTDSDHDGLFQLISFWAKNKPRAVFLPFSAGNEQNDPDLEDFLDGYVTDRNDHRYFELIDTLLTASLPGDKGSLIDSLCLALISLDKSAGTKRVCDYYCSIKVRDNPNDTRLEAWDDSEVLSQLACNCGVQPTKE